ncbi:MAG: T9SS type A sorting domain-containing protein [Candidatus Latescibacteria bacterium]|nr:T9SS type A sorting domain-containing protein [Candidatus Latescibacterota bacterium]
MRKVVLILLAIVVVGFANIATQKTMKGSIPTLPSGESHARLGAGGPDAYGYRWIDNDTTAPNIPTFQWIDISSVGTLVTGLGDDNVVGPFNIGFNFPYYWYRVSDFFIGSNGYIAFGDNTLAASGFGNDAPPNPNRPNNMVAPMLSDLDYSVGSPSCLYWTNAANDTCVITFQDVRWWARPASNCSLQIILAKPDSSITFQYKRIIDQPFGGWTTEYIAVGIENVLGTDGLTYLWGTSPAGNDLHDGLAVKFYPPQTTSYEAIDVGINNAMNENSGGLHLLNNTAHSLWANVRNNGNVTVTNCDVYCRVLNELNEIVYADTQVITSLAAGNMDSVVFIPDWTPTELGVYRTIIRAKYTGDIMPGNDSVVIETRIVEYPTELSFDDGQVNTRTSWTGWGGGYGVKFTSPVYPCRITGAKANLSIGGSEPITCTLYVFAADGPNGSPGSVIARRNVTVNSNTPKWYYLQLDTTINAGSFFVGVISSDSSEPQYSIDTDAPISGQTWEYTGVWAPYRDKMSNDAMMRALIGYEPIVNDVSIEELLAPVSMVAPGALITPQAIIKNWGTANQPNIQVVIKIDSSGINVYTGNATIALGGGDEDIVNFSPQWRAGPAPNTYDIRAYTTVPGDENPANDTIYSLTSSFVVSIMYHANFRDIQPTIDGNVELMEWADAIRYDVSDVQGQGTGEPHRVGSAYMWIKHDSNFVYFAATMPYADEANNGDQIGLYLDEDRNGSWNPDSSEGNYWVVNYETGGVDSLIYRALLPTTPLTTWRYGNVADGQVSCNLNNGIMHIECAVPKGTAKQHLNMNAVRDTMRFWMFSIDRPNDYYYGWWPQSMPSNSWTNPISYGILFFRDRYYDVGVDKIIQPTGAIPAGNPVVPKVVVTNYGLATTSFPVIMTILPTTQKQEPYYDTVYISLGLAQSQTVEFKEFPTEPGTYSVQAKVEMPGDQTAANNIKTTTCEVAVGEWYVSIEMPTNDPPKTVKDGGALVAVNNAHYAFKGWKSGEFKMFDGATWTDKLDIPFGIKPGTEPPKINKKYPGKGAALCWDGAYTIYAVKGNGTREFWAFDMTANEWTAKEFVPVLKALKGGSSIAYHDGKVYLLAGGQKVTEQVFYVYDVASNTWTTLSQIGLTNTYNKKWADGSALNYMNGMLYALKGKDKENFLFAYDMTSETWAQKATLPLLYDTSVVVKPKKAKVGDGGAMTNDGASLYAIKGAGKQDFWTYDPITDNWTGLQPVPYITPNAKKSTPKTGAGLGYLNNYVWLLKGNKLNEFWKYGPVGGKADFVARIARTETAIMGDAIEVLTFNMSVSPNPLTHGTMIRYTVPAASNVTLKLYNTAGRLVETLHSGYTNSGHYTTTIGNISSGVYFLKYNDGTNNKNIKLIVQ